MESCLFWFLNRPADFWVNESSFLQIGSAQSSSIQKSEEDRACNFGFLCLLLSSYSTNFWATQKSSVYDLPFRALKFCDRRRSVARIFARKKLFRLSPKILFTRPLFCPKFHEIVLKNKSESCPKLPILGP